MAEEKNWEAIGREILNTARNELLLNFHYMNNALYGLEFLPGTETQSAATDGERLYYNGSYLADQFLRSQTYVNRMYLHVIFHCLLRHIAKKHGRDGDLWDLACDIAAESIVDGFASYACLGRGRAAPMRKGLYRRLLQAMPVLTAEGIYRELLTRRLSEYEMAQLQREFFVDDHGLWDPQSREDKEQNERQDQKWQNTASKTQTSFESMPAGFMVGGEAALEQLKVASRESVDYRAFLRRFAVPREVMAVDGDGFDYAFYSYGLSLYGNMPLVELPETREERRIEDFVIAVDTSLSTSGELVRAFLSSTYSVLRSSETFLRKMNIRILQCDDQIRSDRVIHSAGELEDYMEHFELMGGSATDFRPVFEHVARLQEAGELTRLRGLLYFTDGMGTYPTKRPPYDVAFVMLEKPLISVKVPPWAIRLTLTEEELHAAKENSDGREPT